jgi:hypothetical protein
MSASGESIRVVHPLFQVEGGGSIPTSPLQLIIGEIHVNQAILLNHLWHSRLPNVVRGNVDRNKHSVCYAAEFGGVFYACSIWTSPVARKLNDRGWLELRRMAIADDAPKNTASRMIKIMTMMIQKKFPSIERLISYQDTEVHKGTIYAAAGWVKEAENTNADWGKSRNRAAPQATGAKIRWGKTLKVCQQEVA